MNVKITIKVQNVTSALTENTDITVQWNVRQTVKRVFLEQTVCVAMTAFMAQCVKIHVLKAVTYAVRAMALVSGINVSQVFMAQIVESVQTDDMERTVRYSALRIVNLVTRNRLVTNVLMGIGVKGVNIIVHMVARAGNVYKSPEYACIALVSLVLLEKDAKTAFAENLDFTAT